MLDMLRQPNVIALTPYREGRDRWPQGSHYRYHRGGHELVRIVRGIGEEHVAAVSRGDAEFALFLDGPLIIMCSRFGRALPWSGGSFHWHRVPRPERSLPAVASDLDAGATLEVSLVEAIDGRVRATRCITLSLPFTRVLHEAILEQARFTYDPGDERRALEALMRRRPSIGALIAFATVRTTVAAE